METIGLVGLGKIGLPIARNLIASGYRVLGYRRASPEEFVTAGGVAARSPAEVGANAEIVLTCLPSEDALDAVVDGADGLLTSARPGQIVAELGSHALSRKRRHVETLAARGAIFVDGEVSGTPGMVAKRQGVVYLAGDEAACQRLEPVARGFVDRVMYFGAFGAASRVKLLNNHLVAIHIAATAEVMALALKTGIAPEAVIEAIVGGSGNSRQFAIRAPWMAEGRYLPAEGTPEGLAHYFRLIHEFAGELDMQTPILDRAIELYRQAIDSGLGEHDNAILVTLAGR